MANKKKKPESHVFQTEAAQLLDLMIHSVYSHKEIFLRELISNASDAIDKLRYESLTNPDLVKFTDDPHIRIVPDPDSKTLQIIDNGIGMTHDEIIENIGTIAHSGTQDFAKMVKDSKSKELPPEMIGQFGVGFYSGFMAADKIELVTRSAKDEKAWIWTGGAGDGSYTLEPTTRSEPGTSITLHLRKNKDEEEAEDYTAEWIIRNIVRKYSDFVNYPIRMKIERTEIERDEEGKPVDGAEEKKVETDDVLNSMKAIWIREEKDVEEEEYKEFYKHISHDWSDPLERFAYKAEGTSEYRSLLYFPSRAPMDLFMADGEHGINLYVKRVFIMNDCKELIPEYLRFMRGVVDSEDLSLNISREILQKNRHVLTIRKSLTRKVIDTLKQMRKERPENFKVFWKEFGKVIKEGLFRDTDRQNDLLEFCSFATTSNPSEETTLSEYIERMKDGQESIYYINGRTRESVEQSPHLESFRAKGYEVLLLTDPVDELWVQSISNYKETPLKSVSKGLADAGTVDERKEAEEKLKEKSEACKSLFESMQKTLDEYVKEVRLSTRLTTSPACLVSDERDMTVQMEQMLRATGQDVPKVKRILEINPEHEILGKLQGIFEKDSADSRLADTAELLHGQALLAEGLQPPDPNAFSRKMADLITKTL
jgi:molecular chaperone HtpG